MDDKKECTVLVDLRDAIKVRVVLNDIMASIGSTLYIRDGVVVCVSPPQDETPAPLRLAAPIVSGSRTKYVPVQEDVLALLQNAQAPLSAKEVSAALPHCSYSGIHSALTTLYSKDYVERTRTRSKLTGQMAYVYTAINKE